MTEEEQLRQELLKHQTILERRLNNEPVPYEEAREALLNFYIVRRKLRQLQM